MALTGAPGPMDTDLQDVGSVDLPAPDQHPPGSTSISDAVPSYRAPPVDVAMAPADDQLFQSAKALVQHHFVHSPLIGALSHRS